MTDNQIDEAASWWTHQEERDACSRLRAEANRIRLKLKSWTPDGPDRLYCLISWDERQHAGQLFRKIRKLRRASAQHSR